MQHGPTKATAKWKQTLVINTALDLHVHYHCFQWGTKHLIFIHQIKVLEWGTVYCNNKQLCTTYKQNIWYIYVFGHLSDKHSNSTNISLLGRDITSNSINITVFLDVTPCCWMSSWHSFRILGTTHPTQCHLLDDSVWYNVTMITSNLTINPFSCTVSNESDQKYWQTGHRKFIPVPCKVMVESFPCTLVPCDRNHNKVLCIFYLNIQLKYTASKS